MKNTFTQYVVAAQHRYMEKENRWYNVRKCLEAKGTYYLTLKEAKDAIKAYVEKWNKPHKYDAKGERYETDAINGFGVTTVMDKRHDYDMEVVRWYIKKRTVTKWENVSEKEA